MNPGSSSATLRRASVAGRRAARSRRRTIHALSLALIVVAATPASLASQDREEILSFDARIEVHDGGRMVVTEAIVVRSLGDEIRRGIYRDFPTDFPREGGWGRIQAPFNVLSVERDGRPEPWTVESIGGPAGRGGVRVRIGNANVLLEDGEHRYRVTYETWRWVRFGDDADQLYWNVTGNGWGFPIGEARAVIILPDSVAGGAVALEAWTGPEGSTASEATATWSAEEASATFATTRALEPREGLTVRVTFPKGLVAPPTAEVEELWFRMDWGGYLDGASVLGLVLALYLLMWNRVGRDPRKGPLVVRYEPPADFSPAALGYLRQRGYDESLLAATLVSLGVKGAVALEEKDRTWSVRRTGEARLPLSEEEAAVLAELLGSTPSVRLTPSEASRLQKTIKALKASLRRRMERRYFLLNRGWFAAGLVASLLGLGALVWRDRYGIAPETWFFALWLSFWSLGTGTLVFRAFRGWTIALGRGGVGAWAEALFLTLFSVPFVGAWIFVSWLLTTRVPQHLVLTAAGLGFLNILFYHLLERPTLEGAGTLSELDGFQAFLTATDADRLDRTMPPERTPELFERYLPHAIALGVENRWAERFKDVLVPRSPDGGPGSLAWYHGHGAAAGVSSLATSLGTGFSSSLSAASSPPSSGGGGGGGGSSGGGGGGGGGGGW